MQTSDLAKLLSRPAVSIRKWAAEFGDYLSPTAAGGEGATRNFTEQDARIMAHISAMIQAGHSRDEIHASLKILAADDWQGLPVLPPTPPGMEPIAVVPTSTADAQRRSLVREIGALETQIDTLQDALNKERAQTAELQQQLMASREQLGELRGKLSAIEGERRPLAFWLITLALAVAVTGIIILGAVALGRG